VFEGIYPFARMFKFFLDRPFIRLDLKSKILELVVHLIFNREPWTYNAYPVKIQDYPPKAESEAIVVSVEENKLIKDLVYKFLKMSSNDLNYDQLLNSVLKMI